MLTHGWVFTYSVSRAHFASPIPRSTCVCVCLCMCMSCCRGLTFRSWLGVIISRPVYITVSSTIAVEFKLTSSIENDDTVNLNIQNLMPPCNV